MTGSALGMALAGVAAGAAHATQINEARYNMVATVCSFRIMLLLIRDQKYVDLMPTGPNMHMRRLMSKDFGPDKCRMRDIAITARSRYHLS